MTLLAIILAKVVLTAVFMAAVLLTGAGLIAAVSRISRSSPATQSQMAATAFENMAVATAR